MSLPNGGKEPKILSDLESNTKNAPLHQHKIGSNYNGVGNIGKNSIQWFISFLIIMSNHFLGLSQVIK